MQIKFDIKISSCYLVLSLFTLFPLSAFTSNLDDLIYSDSVVAELYYADEGFHQKKIKKTHLLPYREAPVNYKNNLKNSRHVNHRLTLWVYKQLLQHYASSNNEPDYFKKDLKTIAMYYSQFPDAIFLIASIKDKPWSISYRKKMSTTRASGSALDVRKADIYIDTRVAVQANRSNRCTGKAVCVSSPADVLLHELLHVSSMLNGKQFIRDGGMQLYLYPHAHELKIIKLEAELYKRMTTINDRKRPFRNSHHGKAVLSSCALCVE